MPAPDVRARKLSARDLDAVVFDMDGVVTDTARVHGAAWRRMFDDWLRARADRTGEVFEPFTDDDYRRYVDGKRREDGITAFLSSRGIDLPLGDPDDPADRETVTGLGARKNAYFLEALHTDGTDAYPGTVALVRDLQAAGIATGVITASRNGDEVLAAAGVPDLFAVRVDGRVAAELGLPGKPDPAVFLEAARRLGAGPDRTAVVEDALAGVQAGRRGGFALVVGVDRTGHADELRAAGADVVVGDLAELTVEGAAVR
ncbi:MAG TPA: beta-phosphoglucomutase family hydrolase [Actinomycetes bacterium]